jgi:Polyketide cyclase / dehydrase and lipid transport
MWTHEESIETIATPKQIWKLFSDVPGWKKWNAGIEKIEIQGPFVPGTIFTMKVPNGPTFTSKLIEVKENQIFSDETIIDQNHVVVHHIITPLSSGNSRITYKTEISGPLATEFGPMVTGDFPQVLSALKELAEKSE